MNLLSQKIEKISKAKFNYQIYKRMRFRYNRILKAGAVFPIALLVNLNIVIAQTDLTYTTTQIERLIEAYSYCLGQSIWLDRLNDSFPEYKNKSMIAEAKFKKQFGLGIENIDKHLKKALGERYQQINGSIKEKAKDFINGQALDAEIAESFIGEVEKRALGIGIPQQTLEVLLSATYEDNPHGEFSAGMTQTYRTKGHPKAKGTDWQLKVPISWKAMEGDRPNIIQKFVNMGGSGDYLITLMVQETGFTDKEARQLINNEAGMKAAFSQEGKVLAYKPMVIDNYPGGMVEIEQTVQRLDITVIVRSQQYFALKDGMMYIMQGAIGTVNSSRDYDIEKEMNRHSLLFRLVANSIILNSQYVQK